jgi:hypothetical protein
MDLTVADLVQRFDTGTIRLPLMQRDYVWKPKKVVRLLDSLYRGWPIGSFYVWQTQDAHPTKARAGTVPHRLDGFFGFLLDGQQRLTSLSLAIQGAAEGELQQRGFFDLVNEKFFLGGMTRTVSKRIDGGDPLLVPLSDIISSSSDGDADTLKAIEGIVRALREQGKLGKSEMHYRERLHKLSKILSRPALCEEFIDHHEEDAFELFSRLNKGGTSLSAGDVEAARLASAGTRKILEPMRALVAEKEIRALGINFVFLLRTLVTVHRGNCTFANLPRNWAGDAIEVETSWKRTEKALKTVVQFVRKDMGWTTRRWLPSTMALIPIVYLLAKSGSSTIAEKEKEIFKRYLLVSGLRSLFRGSPESQVNSFVNSVRDTDGNVRRLGQALFDRIPKNRKYAISSDDVRSNTGLYSPLMQVYLAYLYSEEARTWPSCRTLRDVLHSGLPSDPLAVHHIFPKRFMQERDFPIDKLNTMANYAVLSQADNSELGDEDPADAWGSLKSNQKDCASLQLFFVADDSYLKPNAYDEFIAFRAKKLAERLNKFVGIGKNQ